MKNYLLLLFIVPFITVLFIICEESHSICKISLKDGRTIEADTCEEDGEGIYYYKYGGKIQINRDKIINYSNTMDAATETAAIPEQRGDKNNSLSTTNPSISWSSYTSKRRRELKKEVERVDELYKQKLSEYDECKHISELAVKEKCTISHYSNMIEVYKRYIIVYEQERVKHQQGTNLFKTSKYSKWPYWENQRQAIENKVRKYEERLAINKGWLKTHEKLYEKRARYLNK